MVRIVRFAHRVTGLLGCCVAVMVNHPSARIADRHRPAATSVPNRAASVCHLADTTGMNPPGWHYGRQCERSSGANLLGRLGRVTIGPVASVVAGAGDQRE